MITVKEQFGRRLKSLRGNKGWTQEYLAEKMDISSNYLSSIERGQENPTFEMLIKFSKAFEIEIFELFDFEHETTPEKLKKMFNKFANEINDEKLGLAVRVLRIIAR